MIEKNKIGQDKILKRLDEFIDSMEKMKASLDRTALLYTSIAMQNTINVAKQQRKDLETYFNLGEKNVGQKVRESNTGDRKST